MNQDKRQQGNEFTKHQDQGAQKQAPADKSQQSGQDPSGGRQQGGQQGGPGAQREQRDQRDQREQRDPQGGRGGQQR